MATVPTKEGMVVSNPCYVSSVRTTLCDIMCTVNASLLINPPKPPENLKPLTATLPYNTTKQQTIKKKVSNETLFQKLMSAENKERVVKELKRDKELFFAQLRQERQQVEAKRNRAATKIQALFRGYRKRKGPVKYIRQKKRRRVHTQNDMQDELCTLAAKLGLKPIDGLSLEARSKTSRRRDKILNAAAFRIHRFFSMIAQRARAQRRLEERREEIVDMAARVVTRAVRYVKVKKFVKRCENIKRQQMATKIQCRTRIFQARERVRVRAKERHLKMKRNEAAIIIQRNLAPKARELSLARLAMVTMRAYQHTADEVVSFIENFLMEHGINAAVDVFTDQISRQFAVVQPKAEDRVIEELIDEAVLVEMHIWLEEQMLAILAENQRISEERRKYEAQHGHNHPDVLCSDISWNNLPMEFYTMEFGSDSPSCLSAQPELTLSTSNVQSAIHSRTHSLANSRLASPNVGQQAFTPEDLANAASPAPLAPAGGLIPPSVHHRNNFLRSSVGGIAMIPQHTRPGLRSSITASFNISPQHYRSVMNRLSSIDMSHSVKYRAALLAANIAADSSFSFLNVEMSGRPGLDTSDRNGSWMGSQDSSNNNLTLGENGSPSQGSSLRFGTGGGISPVPSADGSPQRPDDLVAKALEGTFAIVPGIAECDEEEDEQGGSHKGADILGFESGYGQPADDLPEESDDHGSKTQLFSGDEVDTTAAEAATVAETDATVQDSDEPTGTVDMDGTVATADSYTQQSVAEFAEAFASMSITSVLNQFGDSLVMAGGSHGGQDIPDDGTATLLVPEHQQAEQDRGEGQGPGSPHSGAGSEDPEFIDDDGDNASDIGSTYYDQSVAGSLATIDMARHVEEWEVCRDFTAMALTEAEKREIDQLFKDTMHAFYRAKYRKASDTLECFLPILRKLPSADPFHPDVARVQTAIKTIKARILFEQAHYADAKEVFDDALQHRIEVFGKAHYLCLELYLCIGEWHRSQAQYDAAEKYINQASLSVTALIKMQLDATDSETQSHDVKLWHAKNKVLIAQAELLRQSGQYYKTNLIIQQLKASLRQRECHDAESTRVRESFVCLWVSTLCIMGKYSQAVSLLQELLDQRRYRYGSKHPKVATALCALGNLKVLRSEYVEGSEMIEESLAIRRDLYPADHPAIAMSLYSRGVAFERLGRFPEAAADVTHSLEMRRMKLGSEHPAVAQSAMALADIQTQMGDPLRAWKNFNFALTGFRDCYGVEKHRDIAQCLFSMGCSAAARGAYLEAVAYHEQALQLREAILELFRSEGTVEVHLGVELSKVHLAAIYTLVGRLEEAKGFMKGAVKNVTKILGNRNVLVADSLCRLGELCRVRGNYADAKQLFALAFNIVQELFGDDHPLIATIMLLSSENLRMPGLYSEATELATSAYDVRSYLFGSDSIPTAMAVHQRAQLLRDVGKQADAEKQYLRALHILLAKAGENNGLYGRVLADFAECLRLAGKLDLSEKYFNRAIEIQNASFGESSLQAAETLCNFTLLLLDLHHPAEAAEVLRDRVVPAFIRLVGAAHPATLYAKANLALATNFARFFQVQGTDEGSVLLDGVLSHPDIATLIDTLRASSFTPDHPWLLRFAEGSQSITGSSPSRGHGVSAAEDAAESMSVHSSVSLGSSFVGMGLASNAHSFESATEGPASLDSQTESQTRGTFTPRGAGSSSSRGGPSQSMSQGQLDVLSPSDSDSYTQNSYGYSSYTPSEAGSSLAGSMSYSVSQASDLSNAHQSYSQSQSQSQSYSYSHGQSRSAVPYASSTSQSSRRDAPRDSLSEYPEGSLETSATQQSGSYQSSSQYSGSYPSGSYPSSSGHHQSGSRYHAGANYVSQHSAVLEHGDEYSVDSASQSASASVSVSMSLTPRSYRGRRNFSLTPSGTSVMSRQLTNCEDSSIASWDRTNDEDVSLDEYLSRSLTLDDESVASMHTMDSVYQGP